MGVFICPACGHKVSEHADACPECGCNIKYIKKAAEKQCCDKTGYLEAAENGDADAMADYSDCLEFGTNCKIDLQKAFLWAKKSYEKNNPYGCYRYAHLIYDKGLREPNISDADSLKNAIQAALKGANLNNCACISFLAEFFSNNYYFSNPFLAGYYHMLLKASPCIENENLEENREDWELEDFLYSDKRLKDELDETYKKIDSFCSKGSDYDRAAKFAKENLKIIPGSYGGDIVISFKKLLNELRKLKESELNDKFIKYLFKDLIFDKDLSFNEIVMKLDKLPEEKLVEEIFKKSEYIQDNQEAFAILKKIVEKAQKDNDFHNLELDYKYSIPFWGKLEKSRHVFGIIKIAKEAVLKNDINFISQLSDEQKNLLTRYLHYENH